METARNRSHLRAFITLLDQRARDSAIEVRDRLKRGEELPLGGWIVAVKDNIAIRDERLTCGSKLLGKHPATFTATAVERMEAAGAVVLGKTNLDEFAMGSSTEMSHFGSTVNPHDTERVPGGSSGGSAVAVADGIVHAALGSDTGGSVRQPAAFCGICGLKPTYGRLPRYGLVAFGSSLDQISLFGKSCDQVFQLLGQTAGVDPHDSTSVDHPVPVTQNGLGTLNRSLKIGLPEEFIQREGTQPEIYDAVHAVAEQLRSLGHEVRRVSLPHSADAIPVYYVIATAEASSNLARFDGVRYGWRHEDAETVADVYDFSRGRGFGPEVRRRIMMGTHVLSAGYQDAYYKKAQRVRRMMCDEYRAVFREVDLLLAPTTPTTAFRLGEKIDDPVAMYLSDIFTVPANLAGIPAISVPVGRDGKGLPIGLQLFGRHFEEELVLQAGAQIEQTLEVPSP